MEFPRYEAYRDSGLEWLGEIPDHWRLKKTKYLWRELEERSVTGEEQLLSVSQYYGVVPKEDDSRSESLVDYKRCREQDLVVNIMLAWMGGLGVAGHDGIVSPAYCVYRQREGNNPKYFNYLYRSPLYLSEFAKKSKGVVPSRWRMYTEDFGQVLSLIPPRDEQDRIATFLDQKTAEIDEAIAKKQRLIELLKEQKAILINQAVTKGLNPDAPMRDSGVEWIGEVPEHWGIKKLKYVAGGFMYGTSVDCNTESTGIPVLRIPNISKGYLNIEDLKYAKLSKQEEENYLLKDNDILIVRTNGNPQLVGRCALIKGDGKFMFASYLIKVTPQKNIDPRFLATVMASASVQNYLTHSARTSAGNYNLNTQSLGDTYLAYPPIGEQKQIVAYEQSLQSGFNEILGAAEKEISLLDELKSCTIAHAVTGKIKI
jgi:type I restriction enzyme S subunit